MAESPQTLVHKNVSARTASVQLRPSPVVREQMLCKLNSSQDKPSSAAPGNLCLVLSAQKRQMGDSIGISDCLERRLILSMGLCSSVGSFEQL